MQFTNIHEAKSHLSRLVDKAFRGEDVVICKAGKPMARLVSYQERCGPRTPGYWKAKVTISPDFDEIPSHLLASFRGDSN